MPEFDMVIRGGTVFDGTGGEAFAADIAIKDGLVARIGAVSGRGAEEIDATGLVVTPGFVDVHTHYDGQVTWEQTLSPSSNHGVTTVVMGNCGVGFAPARSSDHELVIKLMEGVEDIPEVVMAEGIPWNWESFPEYLDALAQRETDVDFAAQIPHSPLRVYVMGDRGANMDEATPADLARMRALVAEAIRAGALGVSTSRNLFHRFRSGQLAPSVEAPEEEVLALAAGLKDAGRGVFQIIPYLHGDPGAELDLFRKITEESGRPLNYSLIHSSPEAWESYVTTTRQFNASGHDVNAQFMVRPVGVMFGLDLSFHPFCLNPSYRPLADLPLAEKVARLRDPELRARILSEQPDDPNPAFVGVVDLNGTLYPLGREASYNFTQEDSLQARALREGRPLADVVYDALLEDDGHAILCRYHPSEIGPYLAATADLIGADNMLPALGDGGAHYGMICDAAYTTYLLSQRVAQENIDLSKAVMALTRQPAESVGLADRGVLAPGYKADINVIDLARLAIHRPVVKHDLPAGGKRLTQQADGYVATLVSGKVTYREGIPTGARPGRLVRGGQLAAAAA